jgi:PAS domain S-box-containing protein
VTHAIGLLVSQREIEKHLRHLLRELPVDVLLLVVACILPLALKLISPFAYLVVIGIAVAQATRYHMMHRMQQTLYERMRQITLLNDLGHRIARSSALDQVLLSTAEIIQKLTKSPLIYLALVEEDRESIHFPLVMRDGIAQEQQTAANSVLEYVLREKKSICINRDEGMRMMQLGIEPQSMQGAMHLCTPLIVGDKLLGAIGLVHPSDPIYFRSHHLELIETVAGQVSLAVRNLMLYENANRISGKLAQINQAIQKVMFNLDEEDGLKNACLLARDVGESTGVVLYTVVEYNRRVMLRQAIGFATDHMPAEITLDKLATEIPATSIRTLAASASGDWQTFCAVHGIHAITEVPLLNGFAVVGMLYLLHTDPIFYTRAEISLLQTLANQIGAALDNVSMLRALDLYAAEQSQLLHLASISSSSLDLERILLDVCVLLQDMIQIAHVEIALLLPKTDSMQFFRVDETSKHLLSDTVAIYSVPELARLFDQGIPHLALYAYTLPDTVISAGLQSWMQQRNVASIAFMPLQIASMTIGTIVVSSETRTVFDNRTQRILEMAAYQIAAQIHNARIHSSTELALSQRLQEISLIEEIATRITQSLDLPTIIRYVLEAAMRATQSTLAAIVLRMGSSDQSYETIWAEKIDQKLESQRIVINTSAGIAAQVIRSGEMMLVVDNHRNPGYYSIPGTRYQYESSLVVPLVKGDRIVGVLDIENTRRNHFNADHVRFIQGLAGHAAISIDNAYLLEDREYQINTLTLLRTMALETLNVIGEREAATRILKTAVTLLKACRGALVQVDRGTGNFRMISGVRVQGNQIVEALLEIPPQLLERAVRSGLLQIVNDAAQSEAYRMSGHANPTDYQSLVIIPIKRHGSISELVAVAFVGSRQFSGREVNTFDLLAVQIASHLENTALQETIRDSNEQMRAILDANQDGIILLDTYARLQDANAAAENMLLLALRQHIGANFHDLLRSGSAKRLDEAVQLFADGLEEADAQTFTIMQQSSLQHLAVRVYPVTDGSDVAGHVITLRDITSEREIAVFREKIQHMVVHDLRSPLSSIISSIYLAQSIVEMAEETPPDEALIQTLDVSLESANHLMQMVETLRDLPVLAEMRIDPAAFSVRELSEAAINALASTLREASIEVVYDLPEDLPLLWVDGDLIRRVLINLLHNAFKFTPVGGKIMIQASCEKAPDGFMYISVSDTGPGIPLDQRERIFQEFVQIEGRKPRAGGRGMGLGLNFCKLAVEAHGGEIRVEAQSPLSGACFAFYLPYARA